ncbi:ankyrin repeat domain-containing protein [Legionella busanensis]|uniref:ankyrin repeat domain-containing protein n=1 Tax=Legionella busanensis TaxID=190655 RepID=UPI000E1BD9A5|nr:ankyrin repeat domain-containing protein [Legionella busanensis]
MKGGFTEAVLSLLQHKNIAINQTDEDGATPLLVACQNGHIDIVRVLIQQEKIDISRPDNHGRTPLSVACENADYEMAYTINKCRSSNR